jgi:RNA polymerase sigma factor (sigma-70 family)
MWRKETAMNWNERTDDELLAACRLGDQAAYAELYVRYRPAARAAAAALRVPRSERDDAVAEAFANILSALKKGGGPTEAFRPYLVAAVRNITYSQSRRAVRADDGCRRLGVELELSEVPANGETEAFMSTAFDQLPDRWRKVLIAVDVEGRRPSELADELELSPNAVSALVARARRGLRAAYLGEMRRDERTDQLALRAS